MLFRKLIINFRYLINSFIQDYLTLESEINRAQNTYHFSTTFPAKSNSEHLHNKQNSRNYSVLFSEVGCTCQPSNTI